MISLIFFIELVGFNRHFYLVFNELVGASRFGGQVPLKGAQSKRHFISRSHPPVFGWLHGRSGCLTDSTAWQRVVTYSSQRPPARSPSRGRDKSRSLLVTTSPLLLDRRRSVVKSWLIVWIRRERNLVGASRFERPVRPAHPLAGVPRVAPYSSRRHPPALPQELGR